jgi:type I restriction-modification system DNA methylase subunit
MPKLYISSEETHYTERTATQRIAECLNSIIREKSLSLGVALTETVLSDGKYPDILIRDKNTNSPICVIEIKPPYWDALRIEDPVEPAYKKAHHVNAPFFATSNLKTLILFSTDRARDNEPISSQIVETTEIMNITRMEDIERPENQIRLKKCLEKFLANLIEYTTGKKPVPKKPIDELLIFVLQSTIKCLQEHYCELVSEKAIKDSQFSKELRNWFIEQGWSFAFQDCDYEKAAYQASYLLVNKILFYTALQEKLSLPNLTIPEDLADGGMLKNYLEVYFNKVLEIDYETIFSTDFIDKIAFPTQLGAINKVKELLHIINRYQISKIGYDIIGRIFEKLIPISERHKLGQYFTKSDIVDLILKLCMKSEKDIILDPACGAGTFLVRAYQHKKLSNPMLEHEEILNMLWGVDIAKFPAHLSTINLAINNLESLQNYPCIVNKDFFDVQPTSPLVIKGLGKNSIEKVAPATFDCIVGNPPYTRQEEMEDILGTRGYKARLIEKATKMDEKGSIKIMAEISKRAGIHAYFFIHGIKFLKEAGRFGFIVSNSWLDVDYGKGLQEFFLRNYKIITIIESKVERWFEDADINTCIIILEKCSNEHERNQNSVRFAYLKKPLSELIPPAETMWKKQVERVEEIDKICKLILSKYGFYENEDIRVLPRRQSELWNEGFDASENKYVGAKWGKYLRAPEIFFKILEKGKDKLTPLKNIADVKRGITSGANEFFYLTEDKIVKWGIEKEFWMHKDEDDNWIPNYIIRTPRECKSIIVDPNNLKYRVLMIHKDKKELAGTNVLKYIEEGERKGFDKRPTCASRQRWYDLGKRNFGQGQWIYVINERYTVFNSKDNYIDCNLFDLYIKNNTIFILACLNTSYVPIMAELNGRLTLGQGALKTQVYEVKSLPVVNPNLVSESILRKLQSIFEKMSKRPIGSVINEIGAKTPGEVNLDKVKIDRRELDQIVMGEILGLTEQEQLDVYKAAIDLVKSRIEKAKSISKKGTKTKNGINIDELIRAVLENIGENNLPDFYKNEVLSKETYEILIPDYKKEPRIDNTLTGWVIILDKEQISCPNMEVARYLKVFAEMGVKKVRVPLNEDYIIQIIDKFEHLKSKTDSVINEFTSGITDKKLKNLILHKTWSAIIARIKG